jgi:hypothetical protein
MTHDDIQSHKKEVSYRDPESIRWIDLRKHFGKIISRELALINKFDWQSMVWDDWPEQQRCRESSFYNDNQ